jgi:NADH-quinone oxidoreductase subunit J
MSGIGIAAAVFAVLAFAIHSSSLSATGAPFHATGAPFYGRTLPVGWGSTDAPVQQIGLALMRRYVLPLEITALLLTAALIGAVVLAMQERRGPA